MQYSDCSEVNRHATNDEVMRKLFFEPMLLIPMLVACCCSMQHAQVILSCWPLYAHYTGLRCEKTDVRSLVRTLVRPK